MEKKGVLSTLRFMFFTIVLLGLIFSAVVITVINMYKPAVKTYINGEFIGYFSDEGQFDQVYNDLIAEKQSIDENVKVYLEAEPTFETSYIRDTLLLEQNVYTNLRAKIKTEFTIYEVAVNNETQMTFSDLDEATKYSEDLKSEVAKLDVKINEKKVEELGEMTSIERADAILKDIVDRNKPVETPAVSYNYVQTAPTIGAAAAVPTGEGVWPTVNRRINCAYWGYYNHTGIDLGGAIGTAIYAYRSGTVTFAGWSGSYGLLVKIAHSDGMVTYYAHCSELLVSAGQKVSEGQMISKIGMTGNTTGPHLHFEVRINGVPTNPYPYIVGK